LKPMTSGEFLMQGPSTLSATTTEPARALVTDLGASFPKGSDAAVLKRLGAELEMWLHAHPINEARGQRGELPVSMLWLWGAGVTLPGGGATRPGGSAMSSSGGTAHLSRAYVSTPASQHGSVDGAQHATRDLAFGSDPYLAGLWHLHGAESRPLPDQLTDLFGDPHAHRAALVAEVAPLLHSNPHWTVFEALAELDRRFVSPALAALGQGTVERIVLVANDRQLLIRRADRLKLWRRTRSGIAGLRP
ncbi:MAG: hypothetical protein ACRETD_13065, partial [Steroidobacteraceae bacterium]